MTKIKIRGFNSKDKKKAGAWLALAALLLAGAVYGVANIGKKQVTTIPSTSNTSTIAGTNPSSNSAKTVAPSQSNESESAKDNPAPTPQAGQPPITPTGGFVSNHYPGTNNSSTAETSVCNTSPGAQCYIEFTNGSDVKKLSVETTDKTGAAYWYWDVKTSGLYSGSWKITAVATLNGQSKTADDSLNLQVQ